MQIRLSLLIISILLAHLAFAQDVTMSEPITTESLAKSNPQSFIPIDHALRTKLLERLNNSQYLSDIGDFLANANQTWYLYQGDLVIERSLYNGYSLVVDGDVRINGIYDDDHDGTGQLIVLGDMQVEHLLSWGTVAVTGSLRADGLIYTYYNDYIFEIEGEIHAQALLVSDKHSSFASANNHAKIYANSHDYSDDDSVLRHFVALLMAPVYADVLGDEFYTLLPDYELCRERLHAGQAVFRDKPASAKLRTALEQVLDLDSPVTELASLTEIDPLLAALIALREDIPETLQDQLIARADPLVLEYLATNPIVSAERLARLAELSDAAAKQLADHPNAPPSAIETLLDSDDPELRLAALDYPDLSTTELVQLAHDADPRVRERLLWSPLVYRLPESAIDHLVADEQAEIRSGLLHKDGLLQARHMLTLAQDDNAQVRAALAEAIAAQAQLKTTAILTQTQREQLAQQLLNDREESIRERAVFALAKPQQTEIGQQWLQRRTAEQRYQYLSEDLAAATTSAILISAYAATANREILKRLAVNPALPESLQLAIVAQLQPPASRPQLSLFDTEAWNEQRENSHDSVVESLLDNSNISDSALIEIANYCAQIDGQAGFCLHILHQKDLPAPALQRLSEITLLHYREDWALTVLHAPRATRALLAQAIPIWYDDNAALLQQFESIKSLTDSAWWQALAQSENIELRQIAAHNIATPVELLLTLANNDNEEMLADLLGNPNFPQDHALYQRHAYTRLYNPKTTDRQLQTIIEQARAANDITVLEHAWRTLAGRRWQAVQ